MRVKFNINQDGLYVCDLNEFLEIIPRVGDWINSDCFLWDDDNSDLFFQSIENLGLVADDYRVILITLSRDELGFYYELLISNKNN